MIRIQFEKHFQGENDKSIFNFIKQPIKSEMVKTRERWHIALTFLMHASPASCSSLLVELRALNRAAMIFSRDCGK